MRNRKAQSWSMDLVIGVVIFGFIAVIFYSLLTIQQKPSVEELQGRAQFIQQKLENNIVLCGGAVIENQTITPDKLTCLYGFNQTTLKQQLGVSGGACIYIEDVSGYVLSWNGSDGVTRVAIGDPTLAVSGSPCGSASS